jgi:hypothetical protein
LEELMDSRQDQGRAADTAIVQSRLLEWRKAERDVELLRQVSLEEAEAHARQARARYLAAAHPPRSSDITTDGPRLGFVDDEDTSWHYETDWAP